MILLPDMTIEGYAISLQSPYTINGYLITEIKELAIVTNTPPGILNLISIGYIDTDENGMLRMQIVRFNRSSFFVFNETSNFLQEHGPGCDENGRWALRNGLPLTFEKWFEYVKKQTGPFTWLSVSATPVSESYIKLAKRLIKQNRAERYSNNPLYAEPIVSFPPTRSTNSDPVSENENTMCLLPDIEVSGNRLSLQAPYTIDDFLIVSIEESHEEWCDDLMLKITFYNLYIGGFFTFKFPVEDIEEKISQTLLHFHLVHGEGADENGEPILTDLHFTNRSYNKWLLAVEHQAMLFRNLSREKILPSASYRNLVKRLIKQNRAKKYLRGEIYFNYLLFSNSSLDTDTDIDIDEFRNVTRLTNETQMPEETPQELREMINNLCERISNYTFTFSDRKYIHPYDYTPEYIKHTDDPSSLLLGVEIEVGGNKKPNELANREKIVKRCIQIMNGSESDQEDLIYSTSDSSVQIELDTMPCSLTYHKKLNYRELFDFLDKEGYKGHDCEKAGLHVHASRDYLGDTEFQQQITITKIIYLLEKFNNEICVIARRDKNYSPFSGQSESNPIEKFNKYKQKGKNVALNLQHSETIEFRCFKSTLKYESFILILEFVQCIIDFAKSINIEEVESVTWNDLMRKFPTSVTEYYYERLKKIEKKLAKKKRKELNKMKKEWEKEKNPLHKKKIFKEMERVRKESLKVGIKDIVDIEEKERAIAALNGDTIFYFDGVSVSAPIATSSVGISHNHGSFFTISNGPNELGIVSSRF